SNRIEKRRSVWRLTKRAKGTSFCWLEKATKTIRHCPIRFCLGTTANRHAELYATAVLEKNLRRKTARARGLAPSALYSVLGRGRWSPDGLGTRQNGRFRKGGTLNPVKHNRIRSSWLKSNLLRHLCGGRLHKLLALWIPGREK